MAHLHETLEALVLQNLVLVSETALPPSCRFGFRQILCARLLSLKSTSLGRERVSRGAAVRLGERVAHHVVFERREGVGSEKSRAKMSKLRKKGPSARRQTPLSLSGLYCFLQLMESDGEVAKDFQASSAAREPNLTTSASSPSFRRLLQRPRRLVSSSLPVVCFLYQERVSWHRR